jgi:hypothetical protein
MQRPAALPRCLLLHTNASTSSRVQPRHLIEPQPQEVVLCCETDRPCQMMRQGYVAVVDPVVAEGVVAAADGVVSICSSLSLKQCITARMYVSVVCFMLTVV